MDAHVRAWILNFVETHNNDECLDFLKEHRDTWLSVKMRTA